MVTMVVPPEHVTIQVGTCYGCNVPFSTQRLKSALIIQGYFLDGDPGQTRAGNSTSVYICIDCTEKVYRALPNWRSEEDE